VFIKVLLVIGAVPLVIMMIIVVGNSVGRAIFRTPISGTIEIAGLAGAIVVAAAVGFTAREKGNVSVDVLMSRLKSRTKACLDTITYILSIAGFSFLLWAVLLDTITALEMNEVTMTMSIPTAPFKIAWLSGIFITICFLIGHVVAAIRKWRQR
jgi:TRAP-type C4-dicarboxylate transport system permease small subunit